MILGLKVEPVAQPDKHVPDESCMIQHVVTSWCAMYCQSERVWIARDGWPVGAYPLLGRSLLLPTRHLPPLAISPLRVASVVTAGHTPCQ